MRIIDPRAVALNCNAVSKELEHEVSDESFFAFQLVEMFKKAANGFVNPTLLKASIEQLNAFTSTLEFSAASIDAQRSFDTLKLASRQFSFDN